MQNTNIDIDKLNAALTGASTVLPHEKILHELLEGITPVDFFKRAGSKTPRRADYVVYGVQEVLNCAINNGWQIRFWNGLCFIFNGAYWQAFPDAVFKQFLANALERMGVEPAIAQYHKTQTELIEQLHASAYRQPTVKPSDGALTNMLNGTFKFSAKKQGLQAFNAEDYITYQLPFNYDVKAQCPRFKKYLDRVLPNVNKQKVLAEFVASIFIPTDVLRLEKVLVLLGDGANGKSVFVSLIRALLGSQNITGFSIGDLCANNSYSLALIGNALLNFATELSGDVNSEKFKTLASNEPISARRIYAEPFLMSNYARLAFACNELPKHIELSEGFFRRFLIIEFDQFIAPGERDLGLAKTIIDSELSGIFNWVIDGLHRLLSNRKLTECAAIDKALNQYRTDSDTVATFCADKDYLPGEGETILLQTMYDEYRTFCYNGGYKQVSNKTFNKRLQALGFHTVKKRDGINVYVQESWMG